MIGGCDADASAIPTLVDAIAREKIKFEEIPKWAIKFGFTTSKSSRKRKAP